MSINVTEAAYERIAATIASKKHPTLLRVRIYIMGGGCKGFQYGFALDEKYNPEDDQLVGATIVIDNLSWQYLQNSTIDFVTTPIANQFKITNPNAEASCSCGASFALKE